ncbi:CBS domain-containing protein [Candidatus Bathyarchaeota archaeon]|nr:CBS domain-containing protein [Candidatus Bathyarchaeota archaeon]
MTTDVVTVKTSVTVEKAVNLMNRHEIGCLVVVNSRKPIGMVTERDILKRVVPQLKKSEKTRISDVMSKPLITAAPATQVGEAAKLMFKRKIKKLPVVEDGQLVGLVTLTDLVRSEEVIEFLNGSSINNAPKRIKKVVDLYYDRLKRYRRRCPLTVKEGFSMGCQEKRCMWWLGDECAVTKLTRQITA